MTIDELIMYLVSLEGIKNSPGNQDLFNRLISNLEGLNLYNIFEVYHRKRK